MPVIDQCVKRKQTAEHIAKRIRRGEDHANWLGDSVSEKGGRSRAIRLYPDNRPCERCGSETAERHHVDGNTANNSKGNIQYLCRRCHMIVDGRLKELADQAARNITRLIEAAAAEKRMRTHCNRGHELSGENLYLSPSGRRVCKECRKIHKQSHHQRKG